MQKTVCVCGHFAFGKNLSNGQTIKTKIVTSELESVFGSDNVLKVDTHGGKIRLLKLPFLLFMGMRRSKNTVIFPAHNGVQVISPLCLLFRRFFKCKLHYVVIGGWLPNLLKEKTRLARQLKKFDCIYVETNSMKSDLEAQGFSNIFVMPNCKNLSILRESELVYQTEEPYRLCTFSRVMREKGIGDAVEAVKRVNEASGRVVFTLDIYGQVDAAQTDWFESLQKDFPEFIRYGGVIPFDRSTEILKNSFALLFPTHFFTEGIPGTIIDAYASGVPVIAYKWQNDSMIHNGQTGIICPESTDELVLRLKEISQNPSEWNRMKAFAIAEAVKYTPQVAVRVLVDHLSK